MAFPGSDGQPSELISKTESVSGVPAVPAVKVIWLLPSPAVIVPFPIVQAYVEPAWLGTLAVRFGEPAPTVPGAVTTGVGEISVTTALPLAVPGPLASDTAVTV